MLRSKATAALMKLKEIDRKYKIRSNEEVKLHVKSSLSDISGIDEISEHEAWSDEKSTTAAAGPITNTRPKLDIRMPDAHIMERSTITFNENGPELVSILDNPAKEHPAIKSDSNVSAVIVRDENTEELKSAQLIAGEDKTMQMTPSKNSSPAISEEQVINASSSISEDVMEIGSSSHLVSNHSKADVSQEITLKSVGSIINGEKSVQSELDEGPSSLVDSGTYSDDFVKTFSSENARESNTGPDKHVMLGKAEVLQQKLMTAEVKYAVTTLRSYYQRQSSPHSNKDTELETEDMEELVSVAKVLGVDPNSQLATDLTNHVKKDDHRISEETENPAHLLQRSSSKPSSARSSEERQKRQRAYKSSSSRDSKSREFSSNFTRKNDPETTKTPETLNPPESGLQSGQISAVSNSLDSGKEKDSKNPQSISILEIQKGQHESDAAKNSQSPKDKVAGLRIKSRLPKSDIRAGDLLTREMPPNYSEDMSKTQKYRSTVQRGPVTMVEPVSQFLDISKKHEDNCSEGKLTSEHRAIPRGQKRRSNKQRIEDFPRSKNWTKAESLRKCKNQTKGEPGLRYEVNEVARLRQQIREFRQEQDRDQLRARVRRYVKEMMIEQQKPSTHGGGFGGPNDVVYHSGPGLRQTENLRSSFFKPLDLPNVAAFKRPGKLVLALE